MSTDPRDAVLRFQSELVLALATVVRALGVELGGKFSNETLTAIHAALPAVQEAALDVPDDISALRVFDLLLALFPPPSQQPAD